VELRVGMSDTPSRRCKFTFDLPDYFLNGTNHLRCYRRTTPEIGAFDADNSNPADYHPHSRGSPNNVAEANAMDRGDEPAILARQFSSTKAPNRTRLRATPRRIDHKHALEITKKLQQPQWIFGDITYLKIMRAPADQLLSDKHTGSVIAAICVAASKYRYSSRLFHVCLFWSSARPCAVDSSDSETGCSTAKKARRSPVFSTFRS
jgi:hypothetical protein